MASSIWLVPHAGGGQTHNSIRTFAAVSVAAVSFAQLGIANAAEIKVVSAAGFQTVMADLGPKYERASGHKLAVSFANLEPSLKRLQDGEAADLAILPREGIDALVKDAKVAAGSVSPLAQVNINLAVRKGAPKPDITSSEALKHALLAAKSLTYLDPARGGASGIKFANMLDQLGIAKEIKPKAVLAANTKEMQGLIADGKAELAVHQLGQLLPLSGIDIVGPLPTNLYQPIVFTAAVMQSSKDAKTAKALIDFMRSAESAKVIRSKGMEPAK